MATRRPTFVAHGGEVNNRPPFTHSSVSGGSSSASNTASNRRSGTTEMASQMSQPTSFQGTHTPPLK
jgi:hypothetical protein